MGSPPPKAHGLQTNMDVDYVISYRFADTGRINSYYRRKAN